MLNQQPTKPGQPNLSLPNSQGYGPGVMMNPALGPGVMMNRNPHLDSGYQSSTGSLQSAAQIPQFPFSSSAMPPISSLSGEQRLALSAKQGSHAKNSQ